MSRPYRIAKRAADLVGATLGLLLLGPAMAVVALLVRIDLGSPVLFRQERPGRDGAPFTLYKFRTMRDARDASGRLLPDEERTTRLGRALRATSLDETPELVNVLKGEMSLVGPRPLLHEYLPLYSPRQRRRHEVRPGLTGWAQIHGRNALGWEEKFEMDVWYVENASLRLDLAILLRTVGRVATRRGITPDESPSVPRFRGSDPESGRDPEGDPGAPAEPADGDGA